MNRRRAVSVQAGDPEPGLSAPRGTPQLWFPETPCSFLTSRPGAGRLDSARHGRLPSTREWLEKGLGCNNITQMGEWLLALIEHLPCSYRSKSSQQPRAVSLRDLTHLRFTEEETEALRVRYWPKAGQSVSECMSRSVGTQASALLAAAASVGQPQSLQAGPRCRGSRAAGRLGGRAAPTGAQRYLRAGPRLCSGGGSGQADDPSRVGREPTEGRTDSWTHKVRVRCPQAPCTARAGLGGRL